MRRVSWAWRLILLGSLFYLETVTFLTPRVSRTGLSSRSTRSALRAKAAYPELSNLEDRIYESCIVKDFDEELDCMDVYSNLVETHFQVMQLLQGDLAQAIAWRWEHRLGGFREEQLWQWLWHLCSALAFLHRVKILHRDVKPANIFLSKTNDAVLGDFSIAKVLSVATTNTQIGTPGYKAPEVWLGHRYGAKSDIFSLGCSIYEATELRRAFRALASEAYRPSPVLRSCVSNALRLVLRSMLEKTPQRRAGAADLLRRIKTSRSTCLGKALSTISTWWMAFFILDNCWVFGGTPRVTTPRSNKCKNSHPAPSRCRRSVEAEVDVCDGSYPGHWGGICPWKDRVEVSSFYGLEESFIDQTLSCVDTLVFSSSEGESEEDPPFHGDPFQFADVVDPLETTRSTGDW